MSHRGIGAELADDRWELLFRSIQDAFDDRAAFYRFREFFSIPPTLKGFVRLAANIARIIPVLPGIGKSVPQADLMAWESICRFCIERSQEIELSIPEFSFQSGDRPPYIGYYESHCLGVALWCLHPEPSMQGRYLLLQSQLCLMVQSPAYEMRSCIHTYTQPA